MRFSELRSRNPIPNLIMQDFELRNSLKKWRNKEICWAVLVNLGSSREKRDFDIMSCVKFCLCKKIFSSKIFFLSGVSQP